ncbi:MAG: methylenetetrahydrofolate reductase [NAD(P)H] [Candidatus Dormibacteraeota bacterium]|uniref:Methylenetetrahydrofolate reductase n=1 Tax=Candidatus Amunia macphersoniae TaxID=3127014 RepID=A0A934NFP2_9BACT|nr:methylenetetrahydrofolate reductase [NAD(P)H] [Candidatus Dormibacteraeota bacterium]
MRIDSLFTGQEPLFSFEFFPPKDDEGAEKLFATIAALRDLDPAFVSVTHGAGGSSRDDRTLRLVQRLRAETSLLPMAHLTCRDSTVADLLEEIRLYREVGIDNVLAIRGDPPNGEGTFIPHQGGLRYGSELVQLLSDNADICVGAACSPEKHVESAGIEDDVLAAVNKVRAGARFLITQLIFDNAVYLRFMERARVAGIDVPIVPGIMPITNVDQLYRFTAKIGATIPAALRAALESRADDPAAVRELGVAWATLQCSELLRAGAPGVHFITLNRSPATRAILSALRIARPWAIA